MYDKELRKFSIRTDLAIETNELLQQSGYVDGIITEIKEFETIKATKVKIMTDEAAEEFGKPIGTYITLETEKMKINDVTCHEKIIEVFVNCLKDMVRLNDGDTALIIGLGNWNVTPDALGPQVVSKILVTRHIEETPEELAEIRPVAALSPGVMGITGIETLEIVKGLVDRVKPDVVIAIDALAARKTHRVNSTIQIADTGIAPGSGIGNKRMSLNLKTLGVPVIAIGVPTVVDGATLANDAIDRIIDSMADYAKESHKEFYEILGSLREEEKYFMIKELLMPYEEGMFVTPKDIDLMIERMSGIIANGLNIALQENMTLEDINRFVNA